MPKVCDSVVVIVAARARLLMVVAARDVVDEIAPARDVVCDAARAGVVVPVRTVDVALRAVRLVLPPVVVRDIGVVVVPPRVVTGFADFDCVIAPDCRVVNPDVLPVARAIVDVSRTAALAKPMPMKYITAKSKNLFITSYIIISKTALCGQGLFIKINIKIKSRRLRD